MENKSDKLYMIATAIESSMNIEDFIKSMPEDSSEEVMEAVSIVGSRAIALFYDLIESFVDDLIDEIPEDGKKVLCYMKKAYRLHRKSEMCSNEGCDHGFRNKKRELL